MSTSATPPPLSTTRLTEYVALSPDGEMVVLTKEVFSALKDFRKSPEQPTGRIEIDFKMGGIAGVRCIKETRYK